MNTENQEQINPIFSAVSHELVAIMFAEWVQDENYHRKAKKVGGTWYKIGIGGNYYTKDLFKKFTEDMEEDLASHELIAYYSQLGDADKNFGGI